MAIRLKSRHQWPINGFKFIDAAISDQPMGDPSMGFAQLCATVQARREANPRFNLPTDMPTIETEVDEQNANRMLHIRGGEQFIVRDGGPSANFPLPLQRALRSAAGGVSALVGGAAVLSDWLGAGGAPVTPELAEARAAVCAVCPVNGKGDWTRFFTVPASEKIRRTLEKKNEMKLATPHDEQLGVCHKVDEATGQVRGCLCPLKLKVWTPIEHVKRHMTEAVAATLDKSCWVLKE